jgi:hypothetical protein
MQKEICKTKDIFFLLPRYFYDVVLGYVAIAPLFYGILLEQKARKIFDF